MANLDDAILKELQNLLVPFMEDEANRHALLWLAVGSTSVYQRIEFRGPADTFTANMLARLAQYGKDSSGRQALWALLEVVRARVGLDQQRRIDELRPVIESLSEIAHRIASGATCKIFYKKAEIDDRPKKLFGRTTLVSRVNKLLDKSKHVLLTGYGGTGKTALAATIADDRIGEGKGPVVWLRAGSSNADVLFEAIAICFDAKEKLDCVKGDAKISVVRAILADADVKLLVLDDVRNSKILVQMRKAAAHIPMLLTAWQEIENVDVSEQVTDLSPNAALSLLAHSADNQEIKAAAYRADQESRQLCKEMGYHALGVEIAGGWLKQHKRKPGDLLVRIHNRHSTPPTIKMPESYVKEGRQTVKIVLDETFEALNAPVQVMFKTFGSLFEPLATTDLLAVCAKVDDILAAEDALDELVSWNFVTREANYYAMHDMVHSYAETVLFGSAEPNRRPTVAAVQCYVMDHAQNFDHLELNLPNILGAAAVADGEALVSIMSILTAGGYLEVRSPSYFDVRGHTLGLLAQLDKAIVVAEERGVESNAIRHYLLSKRGNAYFDRGDLEKAFETYQAALQLAPNPNRKVILLAVIGKVCAQQGRNDEANNYFKQGYDLAEANDDDSALTRLLQIQTQIVSLRKDYEAVRDLATKGVDVSIRSGQRILEGYFKLNWGGAEFYLGVQKALSYHQEAYSIAQETDDDVLMANVLYDLGRDYHALPEYNKAKEHLMKACELFNKLGSTNYEAEVMAFMKQFGYMKPE